MKIILIGPRSVGKSTIGEILAKRLKIGYFDFDEYVERRLKGIEKHIKKKGFDSYRIEEEKLLKKFVLELPKKCVFSIGGGTVASQLKEVSERNAKLLRKNGKIIYINPSDDKGEAVKILQKREALRKGNKDISETLKLFELRKPIYEKIYDLKFIVKEESPLEIAKKILSKIKRD